MLSGSEQIVAAARFGSVTILATAFFGLAALWVVVGRGDWLVRWSPLLLLLCALVPIGAWQPLAYFLALSSVVIGVFPALERFRRRSSPASMEQPTSSSESAAPARARYSLVGLLKAIVLVAAALAILRLGGSAAWPNDLSDLTRWMAVGAALGVVAHTARRLVLAERERKPSLWVLGCVIVGASILDEYLMTATGLVQYFEVFAFKGEAVINVVLIAALWIVALWVLRQAGWLALPRDVATVGAELSGDTRAPGTRSATSRIAQVTLVLLTLPTMFVLVSVLRAMLPPPAVDEDTPDSPNGYLELYQAGRQLNWSAVPGQDVDTATPQACQAFAQTNAKAFDLVRQALAKPSRVVIDQTDPTGNLVRTQSFRALSRGLAVKGKGLADLNKHAEAADSYVDMLRLGYAVAYGGTNHDDVIGTAIESGGVRLLAEMLATLNAGELATLREDLQHLAALERESLETIQARDLYISYYSWWGTYGWYARLLAWSDATFNGANANQQFSRTRHAAQLNLLIAEAAVRQYQQENGTPPDSLAALTPKYWPAVPRDPYGEGPLIYRRVGDGYLLYSVGSNHVDDGGERESLNQATIGDQGDLFFDAK